MKPLAEADDSELIAAVLTGSDRLAGSEGAFAALVDRYKDRVFRLLSRMCRDVIECEDLAQEVFLKVFRKLHTFQQDSAFFTWLYRIAVNTATDHLARSGRRKLHLVQEEAVLDSARRHRGETPSDSLQPLLDDELAAVTRRVLDTLPEKYRTILILREYEDLSYTDMARVLDTNMGTVESRLFRARQRFKAALERMHPELVPGRNQD